MIIKLSNNEADIQMLIDYLREVDHDFGTPLSSKVNLPEFAQKTLAYGHAFIAQEGGESVALVTLYCNDKVNAKAFLPILSVKDKFRGKGYARQLAHVHFSVDSLVCSTNTDNHHRGGLVG